MCHLHSDGTLVTCQLFPYTGPMTQWLDDRQQRIWRAWLKLNRELPTALGRDLQARSDLSMADFEVLVNLTDVPEGRLRISELASSMNWERSRVSHHLKRMAARGLVDHASLRDRALHNLRLARKAMSVPWLAADGAGRRERLVQLP